MAKKKTAPKKSAAKKVAKKTISSKESILTQEISAKNSFLIVLLAGVVVIAAVLTRLY